MNPQKQHTLPEGWEIKKLGEIAVFINGRAYKQEELLKEGKYRVLRVGNFFTNDTWYFSNLELGEDKYVNESDLMYAWSASFGPRYWYGEKTIFHYHIWKVVPNNVVIKIFLFHLLAFDTEQIFKNKQGGTMFHITKGDMEKREVNLPPLPEQRRIAAVLGTWDTGIEQTTELLKALRARHRGLMHQLLTGKVRLPGFGGEWKRVELSDLFERVNRRNTEGNTNVLTISAQQGLVGQGRYFNKNVASENLANYFLLYRGEFAYNKSYSAGYPMGAIKRLDQYDRGVLSPLYICFRLRNEAENEAKFFTHFFEAGCLNEGIGEIAQEGARNHGLLNVGINDFFSLRIVIPFMQEQRAIAQVLDASLKEIQQQEAKLEALREQKRGLMQCLLTGRVRVPAA